jgi:hypothetical protein
MSELLQFTKSELRAAGLFDADADYDGAVATSVVALMETFCAYGHSGDSAALTIEVFTKLAKCKPIMPLTGDDSEWNDVSNGAGAGEGQLWQNRRCASVFKNKRTAWDIDKPGHRVPITFPYKVD